MAVLLLISLCIATVIQLTSSQSTYDVIQEQNDVNNSCGRTEQMIHELATVVSQLQREIAELKVFIQQKDVKGTDKARGDRNSRQILEIVHRPSHPSCS